MRISVKNLPKTIGISRQKINETVVAVFKSEKLNSDNIEVCIKFVNDKQITLLNKKYLNENRSTDVIAFGMREGMSFKGDNDFLGDIAVSYETAKKQAKEYKRSFQQEILLYIIHGVLHLLGYNDHSLNDRKIMEQKQENILEQ